jgi:tetratricopeptide (TPR) repeat protein
VGVAASADFGVQEMRNRILGLAILGGSLIVGCTSTPTKPDGTPPTDQGPTDTTKPEDKGPEDKGELTVRKVIVAETPKYVEGVDNAAQDLFKEGVVAVYQSPPDYELAREKFEGAIDKDKKFLEGYFNLGMTLERLKQPEKALEVYQNALTNNPESLDAKAYVGRIFLAKARDARATGNDAEATKLVDRAKKLLDEVVAKDPDNVAANNTLALYSLLKGDAKSAEEFVKKVLAIEPFNTSALNTRGLINYQNKEYKLAKWVFEEKVLRADPNSTEALNNLGLTYMALKEKPKAVAAFKKAIELDPENIPARLNLAAIYLDYLNYTEAKDQFQLVLERQPENVEALIGFGTSNWGMQQYDVAVQSYEKVVTATPRYPQLLERMAKIYEGPLSSTPKAIEYYKRYAEAAKLPPDDIIWQQIKLLESGAFDNPGAEGDTPPGEGTPEGGTPPVEGGEVPPAEGAAPEGAPGEAAPPAEGAPAEPAPEGDKGQ